MARQGGSRFHEPLLSPWSELLDQAFYAGAIIQGPGEGAQATFARPDQWLGSWQESYPYYEEFNELRGNE